MSSESREERSRQGLEASSSHEELLRAHYRVLRTIGEGGFASVYLAKHLPTDSLVAVKTISKENCPSVDTELDILKSVEHPNIIKLYQVVEAEQRVNLVMEYLEEGDLADYVYKVVRLREEEARLLFRQIVRAVNYCHDHGIVHRDIKAENILLDSQGTAKLCDFGLSMRFQPQQELDGWCGTMAYCPPEMIKQQKYQGPKVDVWSLGILLYFMVMGDIPFDDRSWRVLKQQVLAGRCLIFKSFSTELQHILRYLMTPDPQKRPAVRQVLCHPWLKATQARSPRPSQSALAEPDPAILNVMAYFLGFDPDQVGAALSASMATYKILKQQQDQGQDLTGLVRHALPAPPPCPSPVCRTGQALHLKQASAPLGHRAVGLPAEQQQGSGGRKGRRSVCLPCLPWRPHISNTEGKTVSSKAALVPAAAAAAAAEVALPMAKHNEMTSSAPEQERQAGSRPHSLPPVVYNSWVQYRKRRRKIRSVAPCPKTCDPSGKDQAGEEESSKLPPSPAPAKTSLPSAQPTTSTTNERLRGWRRWKKNITSCFRNLCCCCCSRPRVLPTHTDSS
ncbi:sperm motility kinase 4A-like [Dipodomys spectabilis]|uniref:sperm motility kinase 4A-like n=1 Tax=Dipodomys spectabilis TaxID=105255 RepID=UPI001C546AAB|nr:sperm motility kinase 4A-like [Dipodomys spectabilis]XP_042535703.1 sperm motility kinase 4A-like [Dipodomys spectabilis]